MIHRLLHAIQYSANMPAIIERLVVRRARTRLKAFTHEGSPSAEQRQLLVDVSVIVKNDARTGIQRVVRALLQQLHRHPPAGYVVRTVFASRSHGYRYAPDNFGQSEEALRYAAACTTEPGDVFLGLDLAAHLLHLHKAQLTQWKRSGVQMHIVVYDLIPVLNPHWFNAKASKNFRSWLRTVAIFADSLICISNTVKNELQDWLYNRYGFERNAIPISTIPLGADIEATVPSHGSPDDIANLPAELSNKTTVLMVGTLEPRKGHSDVLAAFEKLWQQGCEINLVFVGRPGWKTEELQQYVRTHPQKNNHLFWIENASDDVLEFLYACCTGVIVASKDEGFCLPLIEALHHGKPVLARDIPILREIGKDAVLFWSGTSATGLMYEIERWLDRIARKQVPPSISRYTWQQSAHALITSLGLRPTHGAAGPASIALADAPESIV